MERSFSALQAVFSTESTYSWGASSIADQSVKPQDIASLSLCFSLLHFFSVSLSGSAGWKRSESVTLHVLIKPLMQILPLLQMRAARQNLRPVHTDTLL